MLEGNRLRTMGGETKKIPFIMDLHPMSDLNSSLRNYYLTILVQEEVSWYMQFANNYYISLTRVRIHPKQKGGEKIWNLKDLELVEQRYNICKIILDALCERMIHSPN